MESLLTPAKQVEIKNKVKDSKFLGNIKSVDRERTARKFIKKIKEKYYDASHNVYAIKIGTGVKTINYCNDDGEPAGSSGPPVLKAIEGNNLSNVVLVITRYFGGTKLGIGGLVRAYGNTASITINRAGIKELKPYYKLEVQGNYDIIGTMLGQIEAFKGKILSTNYNKNGGSIKFLLKVNNFQGLKNKLIDLSGDKVEIKKIDLLYI